MRQYIGARYVPKFMGVYDNTQAYEALDVVDNGAGTSYIARVPVPPNTPLTDTDYWFVYGASSGAIYDLQNRMDAAENDIGDAQNDISTIQGQITTIDGTLISLDGRLDVVEPIVSRLANRRIIMIGDSYGEQNDGNITNWFWEYFRDALGLTQNTNFFSKFNSGAGFGNDGYLTALQSLSGSITNKTSITDILVCGGWNDSDKSQPYGTDAAFNTGTNNFINYVKNNYPNARMSIAHISWGNPQVKPAVRSQMPVSIDRYESLGSKGFRVLSGTQWILHRYGAGIWQSDGAHPSQQGQGYLGQRLPTAFLNGSIDVDYVSPGRTLVSNWNQVQVVGSVVNGDILEEFHNGVYTISLINSNISIQPLAGNPTFGMYSDGGNYHQMFGTDLELGLGHADYINDTVPIRLYDGNNEWQIGSMEITLHNNLLRMRPAVVKHDGSVPATIGVQALIIPMFTLSIPYTQC